MLIEPLKPLIDDADVVSFDVFDTMLLRRHYRPSDVFVLATRSRSRWFRYLRIAAERIARLRHRSQNDVTLAQIYAVLKTAPDLEILAEKQTLFANPSARAIYEHALERGKSIIAISDMYLPKAVLRELLESAGYGHVERIYVSCEADCTKGQGDLFRHVIEDIGVAADRILHIGDNQISDVIRAREHGLRVWHLPSPRQRFERAGAVHPRIVRYLSRGRDPMHSLLLGILRDGLADAGDDYWYRWGFSVAGPIANAFTDWVVEQFEKGSHSALYLFARDGCLPQQILAIRHPHVPAHYTFASRRLFLVPALTELDSSTMEALSSSLRSTPPSEYWRRLGIANEAVEERLRARFREDLPLSSDTRSLEAFFREVHPLMMPDILRENRTLRDYLAHIGMLAPGARPLIVDIGWRATSQRFLEKAIPQLAGTDGAYFGLSDDSYRNGRMRAWFFDGFHSFEARLLATHCVEITELIFSAPHPSIQRVGVDGAEGKFVPVYEPLSSHEDERIDIVRRIQRGAVDFTRRLHDQEVAGYSMRLLHEDVAAILRAIVKYPTDDDLRHLGRLPHALGLGSSRYETLLPDTLPPHPLSLFKKHFGRSAERLYWPAGLTRAIRLRHGPVRGVAASAALNSARWISAAAERLRRIFGS